MQDNISIQDKVILVTGAFGLIGKTLIESMIRQGAKIVAADLNSGDAGKINELLLPYGKENYLVTTLDITNSASCAACVADTVKKFGRLDVLINNAAIDAKFDKENAGTVNPSRFESYPIELLKKSIDVNITGTIQMTQAACKQMLQQGGGNIINVASTYSIVAPNQSLYDFGDGNINYKPVDYIVTKSFIPNFTRYIATFYGKDDIRCNAIAPHGIYNGHDEKFLVNFARLSPMGRMAEKEELTGPFIFLASDASSYMTGSILTIDGGWTAW